MVKKVILTKIDFDDLFDINSGLPSDMEEIVLDEPDTEEFHEYQKGQDIAFTISTNGWLLIRKLIDDLVSNSYKEFNDYQGTDLNKLAQKRDKKMYYKEMADKIYTEVDSAVQIEDPRK